MVSAAAAQYTQAVRKKLPFAKVKIRIGIIKNPKENISDKKPFKFFF